MSEGLIGAIFGGIVALLGAGVPAWVKLKRAWQELEEKKAELRKKERADVLDEWRGIVDLQAKSIESQGKRIDSLEQESAGQREQIRALYTENSQLRGLIAAKDIRVEKQAGKVEELRSAVAELKQEAPVPPTHVEEPK